MVVHDDPNISQLISYVFNRGQTTHKVAVDWRDLFWVVCGNRRLWTVREFVRRHGEWTDAVPQIPVIVHKYLVSSYPFNHLDPRSSQALLIKALDAMGSTNDGLEARLR